MLAARTTVCQEDRAMRILDGRHVSDVDVG
jgi:hypothetical protein